MAHEMDTPEHVDDGRLLTAWDLKQYEYCQRVLYYTLCLPVRKYTPPKVVIGGEVHQHVERLERRRSVRRYGFGRATKQFEVDCSSPSLGLIGRVDLVLDDGERMAPIELKWTRLGLRPNIQAQLATYSLMLEETFARVVDRGFLVEIPHMQVYPVDLGQGQKRAVVRRVESIRRMIREERLPEPTPHRAKCVDCELLTYCGDVG